MWRRACLPIVLLLGLAPGAAADPAGRGPAVASQAPAITLSGASARGPSAVVTMPPVGLSLEYPVMAQDLGGAPCPPPAFVSALTALGSPPISLAGESQDRTAPPGALTGAATSWETATLYPLPATFWGQLHCLLATTRDPLTVGLDLLTAQGSWASQMVAGAEGAATAGLDFSLGNEPDLYKLPNYSALDKPQPGEETLAVNLYLQLAGALLPALGGAPVIGPELGLPARWEHELPRIISTLHDTTVGVHLYPLTDCVTPRAVTIKGLLSASAANAPRNLAWVVADADAAGAPAIISEANSASCGGKAGVTDSPAAAVWAVRFVLSALETGFREVRFHFSGGPYDAFVVHGGVVLARPLDSALVALNQWLAPGASVQALAGVRGIVATAVAGSPDGPRMILDNQGTRPVTVVLRSAARTLRLERLSASAAGLQSAEPSLAHGRLKLAVQPSSIVAVLPG